ncbi:MAG: PKD domain-containing protein [bacterium]|nr:PKD domain-containing protein [bacterium]
MHKKIILLVIVVIFCIAWTSNPVRNTPVCTVDHEQKRPQLAADDNGGAVIVWEDSRSGSDYDIYAQRLDAPGTPQWTAGGIAICAAVGPQRFPQVTADNSGGFIVTWFDRRNGKNYDIYAQRIDSTGRNSWPSDGVPVCTAKGEQYDPVPVSDGNGGAVIIWQDRRHGSNYDIYAQRIDASGKLQWDENGVIVCTSAEDQENPRPVSDGNGGIIITWQDRRNAKHYDIYAQRLDGAGSPQWTANGIEICAVDHDQRGPRMLSDDRGGAVITWQDKRNGADYDIYAQRIDNSGRPQWTVNGVVICKMANNQYDPAPASDGSGGAVITWQDYRKGADCSFDAFAEQTDSKAPVCDEKQLNDWNVYAQRINSSGRVKWAVNGIPVCTANVDQFKPQVAADGFGGTIIAWRASDKENDHNIYAQHLNAAGKLQWAAGGVAVSTAPGNQLDPLMVTDGKGGAIVAWYDQRKGNTSDIYAQKICASGEIGGCSEPIAVIGAASDGTAALMINFSSSESYDPDGSITSWRWNFGDGRRASTENAAHNYTKPGTYTVTLRVRDNNGKWSSRASKQITVKEG